RLGADMVLNDVTSGTYLVAVDEAPMADTFQDQQFQDLVTMAKDLGIPIPPDIIVDASNVPRKREIIKRIQGQQQAKPQPKVAQSINFKDLPPEGQAQMAAEVGINLNPQGLAAQAMAQPTPQPGQMPGAPQPSPPGVPGG